MHHCEMRIIDSLIPSNELILGLKSLCEIYNDYKTASRDIDPFAWFEPLDSSISSIPYLPSPYHSILSQYFLNYLLPVLQPYSFGSFKCEWWCNKDNTLNWHIDKNESDFLTSKVYHLPLLSTVFYPFSDCIHGELLVGSHLPIEQGHVGRLPGFTSSTMIPPLANRLVMFSPGLLHRIMPFTGSRYSLAMNLWPV